MPVTLLDAPVIDDATRRGFLTGAAAAALLAGCGRGPAWAAPADGGFPVTVDHRFGSTAIPAGPRRIVTVGLNDHDVVYALGAQPVAASPWFTGEAVHPWSEQAVTGAAVPVVLSGQPAFSCTVRRRGPKAAPIALVVRFSSSGGWRQPA